METSSDVSIDLSFIDIAIGFWNLSIAGGACISSKCDAAVLCAEIPLGGLAFGARVAVWLLRVNCVEGGVLYC